MVRSQPWGSESDTRATAAWLARVGIISSARSLQGSPGWIPRYQHSLCTALDAIGERVDARFNGSRVDAQLRVRNGFLEARPISDAWDGVNRGQGAWQQICSLYLLTPNGLAGKAHF